MTGRRGTLWRVRRAIAGGCTLAVLTACAEDQPSVAELLTNACAQARNDIAAAPAPVSANSDTEFVNISRRGAMRAGRVAHDLADRGDDTTIADMAWQLDRFPVAGDSGHPLAVAQEASAAIIRLDRFAHTVQIPQCGAATWRPAEWRAMADRHGERLRAGVFRRRMDRLCAETFPQPSLLADGTPLLDALVADASPGSASRDATEDPTAQIIARLDTLSGRQSDTATFLRDFAEAQPHIHPPERLEGEHLALLAAFKDVESALPRTMPRDPPPAVRERVGAALDELQRTWDALGITCQPDRSGT